MNQFRFIFRFITSKGFGSTLNKRIIFPVIGVAMGVTTVLITLSIMNGLEFAVFKKLIKFYSPARIILRNPSSVEIASLSRELNMNQIHFQIGVERDVIIRANDKFRFVTARAIDNSGVFVPEAKLVGEQNSHNKIPGDTVIIGDDLSYYLSLEKGDSCQILSPVDISLTTGVFPSADYKISDKFNLDLIDLDMNYIIIPYSSVADLFKKNQELIFFLNEELTDTAIISQLNCVNGYDYRTWEDEFGSLISAMKLEKLAYSLFGFIIILLSCFNMVSIMSMTVMRKIPQIGILKTMGYSNKKIYSMFFIQAIFTGLIGSILGYVIAYMVISLNEKYQLLSIFLEEFPSPNFPLILNNGAAGLIILSTIFLVVISSIFPSIQTRKLTPINSLNLIK